MFHLALFIYFFSVSKIHLQIACSFAECQPEAFGGQNPCGKWGDLSVELSGGKSLRLRRSKQSGVAIPTTAGPQKTQPSLFSVCSCGDSTNENLPYNNSSPGEQVHLFIPPNSPKKAQWGLSLQMMTPTNGLLDYWTAGLKNILCCGKSVWAKEKLSQSFTTIAHIQPRIAWSCEVSYQRKKKNTFSGLRDVRLTTLQWRTHRYLCSWQWAMKLNSDYAIKTWRRWYEKVGILILKKKRGGWLNDDLPSSFPS